MQIKELFGKFVNFEKKLIKVLDEMKKIRNINRLNLRGHSLVVKPQSSKLVMSVRFRLPAPFIFVHLNR